MTDMILSMSGIGEIKVSFGTKNGYSPYFVTKSHNPSELKDLIGFFNKSTLDMAIKETVEYHMDGLHEVYLVTGDGQIITVTKP